MYYIKKKKNFLRNIRNLILVITVLLSRYHKLVKTNVKVGVLNWLNATDDNFRTQAKHFWKYIS
jgi:hypothetical protein